MATERQIGIGLTSWVKANHGDKVWMHIANEGHHAKVVEGVLPGAPDYLFAYPVSFYGGLFIELKTEKGKLSEKQRDIGKKLIIAGYRWEVCYGFNEAVNAIRDYLSYE